MNPDGPWRPDAGARPFPTSVLNPMPDPTLTLNPKPTSPNVQPCRAMVTDAQALYHASAPQQGPSTICSFTFVHWQALLEQDLAAKMGPPPHFQRSRSLLRCLCLGTPQHAASSLETMTHIRSERTKKTPP